MSDEIRPHKKLKVWQKVIELGMEIYKITEKYPQEEKFGLTAQMRRAAISIGSNIAEGAGRQSKKEFLLFLYFARGSISELDTQIEISTQLGYLKKETKRQLENSLEEVSKMLSGLINNLKRRKEKNEN